MRSPSIRHRARWLRAAWQFRAVLVLIAGWVVACTDANPVHPRGLMPRVTRQGLSHDDSVARGYFNQPSPVRRPASPSFDAISDGTASIVSVSPSLFQGFAQPSTISVTVAGRVNSVSVVGSGAIECSGSYGTLIGYDATGAELGEAPLQLIDPADCSPDDNPDNVTFGAQATLTVASGIIARFEITPMSPLEFPVFNLVGHASATYAISLGVAPPPTLQVKCDPAAPIRGTRVTCTATLSDGSAFTPTHQKSVSGGITIVDADVPTTTGPSYAWTGIAVVPTDVTIQATMGGTATSASSSFGVTSRIGNSPDWLDPEFKDFPENPPAPTFVGGPPLTAPYPGITVTQSGYNVDEGALGFTFFNYPTTAQTGSPRTGPDAGIRFVLNVTWKPVNAQGAAAGIYVEQSLQASDPFYQRQTGPSPKCTQSDMAALSSLIQRHESAHWTEARTRAKPLKTQTVIEGLTQLPGDPPIVSAFTNASNAYVKAIADANNAVETSILPVQPNAPVCEMRP